MSATPKNGSCQVSAACRLSSDKTGNSCAVFTNKRYSKDVGNLPSAHAEEANHWTLPKFGHQQPTGAARSPHDSVRSQPRPAVGPHPHTHPQQLIKGSSRPLTPPTGSASFLRSLDGLQPAGRPRVTARCEAADPTPAPPLLP